MEFEKKLIDQMANKVYEVCSKTSTIIMANGEDLLNLNMDDFGKETYFISDMNIEKGKFLIIIDEDLKKELYKFCISHEDRVFKGTKGENNAANN